MATGHATFKLASGHEMPAVGYGLWKVPKDKCADTVYEAIKLGYRLFDGAYDYMNEAEAGQGIRRAIDEGLVKREDIFVTTKLWNNYHHKDKAVPMMKAQNEAWGLGYIDLFLIHFPVSLQYIEPEKRRYPCWWMDDAQTKVEVSDATIRETWEAMEEIVDLGIAKSIGVSNFQAQTLLDLSRYAKKPISSLQIEHHPYLVQQQLIDLAHDLKIVPTAYSSFGPMSYREMGVQKGALLFEHDVISSLSKKHNKTPAQILLRWATQRGIAVIPKSNNVDRLKANLEVTEVFHLEQDELNKISSLNSGLRFNDPAEVDPMLRIFA